jgi:hypothetical protein
VSDRDDERPVALEPTAVAGTAQTLPGVAVAARAEPAAARDGLRPGTVVGRFVVERKVGAGGMGEVYAAYDPHLDRRVAIKILQAGARGADAAPRLVREAQALAKLAHPNVVAVHEVGETAGGVFLAMQFVEGTTLGEHLARERPRWDEVVRLYVEAGRGLAAAHAAGLIHRDVKPSNVLIDRAGRVAVTDFGVARAADEVGPEAAMVPAARSVHATGPSALSTDVTQAGAVIGTPAYMAPEQHAGRRATAASDQFGFCVALWQGLFGAHPYVPVGHGDVTSPFEYMAFIGEGALVPPPTGAKVPRRIVRALVRGLARDPSARWPTMEALLSALEPRAPYRGAVIALSAVAALGVGAAVWLAVRPAPAPADRCGATVASRAATAWSPARRQAIVDGFAASGRGFAARAAAEATERLDGYATAWTARAIAACAAPTAPQAAARDHCLARGLAALGSVTQVLGERPPAELVDHAVAVVSGLPALAACDDARALAAEDVPPPTQAAQVAALEARLTAAKARTDAGLYAAAVVELEALVAEADTVAWAPLVVRATLAQGELALARLEPAEGPLTRAATLATERHLDREAAAAWQALAHAAAVARRADAVAAYAEIAAATARATGDAAVLRRQRIRQARVLVRLRRFADSERACRAVLAEVEADATADPRDRTAARDCLLEALVPQAKFDEAATLAEGLLADRRIHSGADHPAIADYTRVLGHLAYQRGDLDGARDRYRAAHELRLRVFGPRHVRTAESYGDLAGLEPEPDQRRRMLEEAIAVMAASDSPLAGLFERGLQAELAELAYRRDDPAAMRAHFDRAEILAAKHGPRSIDVAATLLAYGQYLTASDLEAGLAKLRLAVEIFEELRSPQVLTARGALALVLGYHDRAVEAVAVLEPVIRDANPTNTEPFNLALLKWSMAQNLMAAGGDRARARGFAEAARAEFAKLGDHGRPQVVDIDRWLRKHRR